MLPGMEGGGGAWVSRQPALQCSLFTGQSSDSAQIFPDFDKLRGVVLFLFWGFFQLKEGEVEL
jgi:hypothetical protein